MMDNPTRSEFEALKKSLQDQNNQIMDLVLRNREDIRQQTFGISDSSAHEIKTTDRGRDHYPKEHLTALEIMLPDQRSGE